jgi:hypothetical protein
MAFAASLAGIGYWMSARGAAPGLGLWLLWIGSVLLVLLPGFVAPALLLRDPIDRNHVRVTFALMTLLTAGVVAWIGTLVSMKPGNDPLEFNTLYFPSLLFAFFFNLFFLAGGWLLRKLGVRIESSIEI